MDLERGARIREIRLESGLSLAKFAGRFTDPPLTPGAVHLWEKGGGISDKHIKQIVWLFGVREAYIRSGELPKHTKARQGDEPVTDGGSSAISKGGSVNQPYGAVPPGAQPPVAWGDRDVPILGGVVGGKEGVFVNDGGVLGYMERPPSLRGVEGAYYVTVYGDSMYPLYRDQEGVWVNPHAPLRPERGVVVVMAGEHEGDDLTFFIKEFVRRTSTHLICKQFNPEVEVKYPLDRLVLAHRVWYHDQSRG